MMKDLLRFCLPHPEWFSQSRFCLGLLVVILVFGITLNTLLDVDCFQTQAAVCCCSNTTDPASQDTELQTDTCTHCTGWLPTLTIDSQPVVSFRGLPFYAPIEHTFSVLHFDRPPIFA